MADDPHVLELVDAFVRQQSVINQMQNMLDNPARVDRANDVAKGITETMQIVLDKICDDLAALIKVPVAAVTLVNKDQQLVLGACGMSHAPVKRDHSFCIFVAASGTAFEMQDVPLDELKGTVQRIEESERTWADPLSFIIKRSALYVQSTSFHGSGPSWK
jgi:hypothetical protein